MKKSVAWVLFSVVVVFIGSLIAFLVQTDFGKVQVKEVRFISSDGKVLSAYLFLPKGVSAEKPAPAVLTMHGYINSRETQSGFNIEFARRGYVVLAMDMAGHGYSEQIKGGIANPTRGAEDGLLYLASLPFVDKQNIAVEGHSMGGWSVLTAAGRHPDLVKTVILMGSSSETFGAPKVTIDSGFNFAVIFSKYDEFSKLMWGVDIPSDIVKTAKLKTAFGTTEDVVPGKLYGSFENETARKLYIPNCTHPGDHLSTEAIGYAIEFLQDSIKPPKFIDPKNQIWPWKEFGTLLGLIGGIMFLISYGAALLDTNYFKSLHGKAFVLEPKNKAIATIVWWIGFALVTGIPALIFFRFQKNVKASAFWPQSLTVGFAKWATLNALIAVGLFIVWHFAYHRRMGANMISYGLSTSTEKKSFSLKQLWKAFALAVCTVFATHIVLSIVQWALKVDFRWWVIALKPMDFARFWIFIKFLPPFALFTFVNALVLNGQLKAKILRSEVSTTALWMVSSAAANCLGIAILVALQVGKLYTTQTLFFPTESLLGIVAYQFVFLTAVAGAISAFFYRRTGSIYVGAFTNALFVTWYIVAGQAIQFAA
ncbi:alpha/beta hydrolase family protein [Pseudothermotoga thermarum]|uniref:Alpha/beta hydrolase fold protein n=1 Tax=Pseudothermotoga thermarum DSM 5069 TaxID=688269 RepID=F7YYP4_9THEM|nr:alpha/beta fold hydrolase [Pseudothermotoga thermarum]AEH51077.1 alpha/beta hydrolase fold protein [Pseudothermotoga thermarum DSM 5069]